ncbi:MAG: AMP-binding protein [Myxococcota bacterium]
MTPLTVYELLQHNLPHRADHPAIVHGSDGRVSYRALSDRVDVVAAWLRVRGVQKGDRVGLHLPKSVDEVVATLAIAKVGAVWVNINARWMPRQVRHVAEDCDIRVLITDRRRARGLVAEDVAGRFSAVLVRGRPTEETHDAWDALAVRDDGPPERVIGADLATLLYTSGSTGLPKGVMTTHRNVVDGARIVSRYLGNRADDRVLGLLPMSFDYGLNQLTTMLYVGGTLVLQPVMMPTEILRTVLEHEVTGLAAVPPAWIPIVRHLQAEPQALPSLRTITNTGGAVPDAILEAMPQVFPGVDVVLMYGLTEAFRSCFLPPERFADKRGAIGGPIPDVDIYVVHPDRGLQGPGGEGELVHRGALVSRGYWGQPEATAARLRPNVHLRGLVGDEPVLHSGDLVRIDDDGILWFVGRADSLIKCSGFRVSPTEVEEALFASGIVGDVVAWGEPDDELGQVVHVAVGAREGRTIDVAALEAYTTRTMPTYMRPRRIHPWREPMPRTASGKLDRPRVVATARESA